MRARAAFQVVKSGVAESFSTLAQQLIDFVRQLHSLAARLEDGVDLCLRLRCQGRLAEDSNMVAAVEEEPKDTGLEVVGKDEIARAIEGAKCSRFVSVASGNQPACRLRSPLFVQNSTR